MNRRPLAIGTAIAAAGLIAAGTIAANANHTYGEWNSVPASMVGDPCDSIDGGTPKVLTIGEHAMYHDTAGTRYVITMAGRICSS